MRELHERAGISEALWNRYVEHVEREEGFRGQPYDCGTGRPFKAKGAVTVGFGFNTDAMPLSREACLLELAIRTADAVAAAIYFANSAWDSLNDIRKLVLIDMAYNLGRAGLINFVVTRGALHRLDFKTTAKAMLDSKWARQVPNRAKRLAEMMRTGDQKR